MNPLLSLTAIPAKPRRGDKFEGNPCKEGGHTVRYRSNGACVVCSLSRKKP